MLRAVLFTHIRTKRHSKLGLTLTNTCLDESLKRSGSIITQLLCLGIQVPWENQTFKVHFPVLCLKENAVF